MTSRYLALIGYETNVTNEIRPCTRGDSSSISFVSSRATSRYLQLIGAGSADTESEDNVHLCGEPSIESAVHVPTMPAASGLEQFASLIVNAELGRLPAGETIRLSDFETTKDMNRVVRMAVERVRAGINSREWAARRGAETALDSLNKCAERCSIDNLPIEPAEYPGCPENRETVTHGKMPTAGIVANIDQLSGRPKAASGRTHHSVYRYVPNTS